MGKREGASSHSLSCSHPMCCHPLHPWPPSIISCSDIVSPPLTPVVQALSSILPLVHGVPHPHPGAGSCPWSWPSCQPSSSSSSLLLPISTPQAVAHGSSWGCCCAGSCHCWLLSPPLTVFSSSHSIVPPLLAASNCDPPCKQSLGELEVGLGGAYHCL
jgi:hypothetical protein